MLLHELLLAQKLQEVVTQQVILVLVGTVSYSLFGHDQFVSTAMYHISSM